MQDDLSNSQPDHLHLIQDFFRWVDKSCVPGIQDPATGSASERPFLPNEAINSFFRKNNFNELQKLLEAVFAASGEEPPVDAEIVARNCPKVFCILLEIGKGRFIQNFTQSTRVHDQALPFDPDHLPAEFPRCSDVPFHKAFCEKQWKYCARPVERGSLDLRISNDEVLPIIEIEKLGGGSSAAIHRIVLHQGYNLLEQGGAKQNLNELHANTFILKTYRTINAERYYRNEIDAFRRLKSSRKPDSYIIGFHGSFVKGGTYNVLLEYADQGTLEDYFKRQEPPKTREEIYDFWNSLFQIIRALIEVHDVEPLEGSQGSHQIMRGWHQDVKPANILVASKNSKSPYQYQFKLGDLGLTHFRKVSSGESDMDSYGTRAYGAPETYRPDSTITNIKVLQNVDIWSLGAVFSEAAVWIVYGFDGRHGVEDYRRARQLETNNLHGFEDGDAFHNGEEVLETVREYHRQVISGVRAQDSITESVLNDLVTGMLAHSDERPTAKGLWRKVVRINNRAKSMVDSLRPHTPPESRQGSQRPGRIPPPMSPQGPPPTSRSYTNLSQIMAKNASQIRNESYSLLNGGIRAESPTELESDGEEDENPPPRKLQKGKSVARDSEVNPFLTTTVDDGTYQTNQTVEGTEEPSQLQNIATHGRITQRPSGHTQIPSNSRITPIPRHPAGSFRETIDHASSDEARISQQLNLANNLQSHARLDVRSQSSKRPLPYLSVEDAKKWRLGQKDSGRLFRKKKEQSEDFTLLDRLDGRDYVFLIDDSAQMKEHWKDLTELSGTLASMIKGRDSNGFDVFFTVGSERKPLNFKKVTPFENALKAKGQRGTTDIGIQLNNIISIFQSRYRPPTSTGFFGRPFKQEVFQPMSLFVLTNGLWESQIAAETAIKSLVRFMGENDLHNHHFMIQFITFGVDPHNPMFEHLDNGLHLPLDIVDTTPSTGNVWKMLFGSTNERFDTADEPRPIIQPRDTMNSIADATTLHETWNTNQF